MSSTQVHFAVLGMLSLRPMTGYEIKQVYEKGPANFMPISFGQIYPALAKLKKEKMARQEKQPGGRGRIRYFITPKGEETLRQWMLSPPDPINHRELLLRLFFAAPRDLPALHGLAEAFLRKHQTRLDLYDGTRKWLNDTHGGNSRLAVWKLVLEYGVALSESRVRWAERALALTADRNGSEK